MCADGNAEFIIYAFGENLIKHGLDEKVFVVRTSETFARSFQKQSEKSAAVADANHIKAETSRRSKHTSGKGNDKS